MGSNPSAQSTPRGNRDGRRGQVRKQARASIRRRHGCRAKASGGRFVPYPTRVVADVACKMSPSQDASFPMPALLPSTTPSAAPDELRSARGPVGAAIHEHRCIAGRRRHSSVPGRVRSLVSYVATGVVQGAARPRNPPSGVSTWSPASSRCRDGRHRCSSSRIRQRPLSWPKPSSASSCGPWSFPKISAPPQATRVTFHRLLRR